MDFFGKISHEILKILPRFLENVGSFFSDDAKTISQDGEEIIDEKKIALICEIRRTDVSHINVFFHLSSITLRLFIGYLLSLQYNFET